MSLCKITVGIPTYNGSVTITNSIESVLLEVEAFESGVVELIICDNSSEDSTWEILTRFMERYPDVIRTFRNDTNVGFDRNVDLLFKYAHGDFVWLLGDDDIITKGSIQKVLNIIDEYSELGLLFVGGVVGHEDDNIDGILCENGAQFLMQTSFKSGGMSANIIRRSSWLRTDVSRYLDTNWVHFGMVIEIASREPGYAFIEMLIDEPVLMPKKWGLKGGFLLFGIKLIKVFRKLPELGYDAKCIRRADQVILGSYPRQIIKARALGLAIDMNLIRQFVSLYRSYPSFWLVHLPCLLMPAFISRFIYDRFRPSRFTENA